MKPLVSIIITYYNYEKYIKDCLLSCIAQTYPNIEIIVVNDASPDEGYKIINLTSWQHQDANIKLITHVENKGYAAAKNTGIRAAKGEFIVFIDADDCLTPDSVEVRVKAMASGVDFVDGHVYEVTDVDLNYKEMMFLKKDFLKSPGTQRYYKKEHKKKIHAQGMMFRKSVFEKFGLYWNINSKADKEMNWRLGIHPLSPLQKKIKRKHIENFVAYYRRHPDSMKGGLSAWSKEDLRLKFIARIQELRTNGITKENTEWL